jgi:hypothetical protein
MEMMENLSGLPHSHTPPLTPITPSDFLPIRERIFYYFFPGLKAIGGHILSMKLIPYFTTNQLPAISHTLKGGIYYQ